MSQDSQILPYRSYQLCGLQIGIKKLCGLQLGMKSFKTHAIAKKINVPARETFSPEMTFNDLEGQNHIAYDAIPPNMGGSVL